MARRFRLSQLLVTRLDELGIPSDVVIRRAGIPKNVGDDRMLVTTEQFFAFWAAVEELSGNPLIGLVLGTEQRVERYDPIALASLSASSFRDAVDRAARYKQLTCPGRHSRRHPWRRVRDPIPLAVGGTTGAAGA